MAAAHAATWANFHEVFWGLLAMQSPYRFYKQAMAEIEDLPASQEGFIALPDFPQLYLHRLEATAGMSLLYSSNILQLLHMDLVVCYPPPSTTLSPRGRQPLGLWLHLGSYPKKVSAGR